MLNIGYDTKIYLCTGCVDMRKGINGLAILAKSLLSERFANGALFVFRGKQADRLKILWWDGQGFCLFYKCLEEGRFTWFHCEAKSTAAITKAQLSMLIEGMDWRNPRWSNPPKYSG